MAVLRLPGLIDVHTHLRVPGGEHKEDFSTGSAAALAGGVTQLLAMPNTQPTLSKPEILAETIRTLQQTARCDIGLFAGASSADLDDLAGCAPYAYALKIYLNDTFGRLRVDSVPTLVRCFTEWPRDQLIALHAEEQSVAVAIGLCAVYDRPIHLCHISRKEEIELIADAKMRGLPVTCEVAPHHLFMDRSHYEAMGAWADMRPVLGTKEDVEALWHHLAETVDCVATDHAPHTRAEKQSATPPPGVAGLQTSLPLMLTAVHQGRVSLERVIALMHTNPQRIFNLPPQTETYCDVDVDATFVVRDADQYSKCGWTPFAGWELFGRIQEVTLRGSVAYREGELLAQPGTGQWIPFT